MRSWLGAAAAALLPADQITVNGVPQPLAWDNDGGLGKMIRSLLGR